MIRNSKAAVELSPRMKHRDTTEEGETHMALRETSKRNKFVSLQMLGMHTTPGVFSNQDMLDETDVVDDVYMSPH